MTVQESLLPCPFCGGEAEVKTIDPNYAFALIQCTNCGCATDEYCDKESASDFWNRRYQPVARTPIPCVVPAQINQTLNRRMYATGWVDCERAHGITQEKQG